MCATSVAMQGNWGISSLWRNSGTQMGVCPSSAETHKCLSIYPPLRRCHTLLLLDNLLQPQEPLISLTLWLHHFLSTWDATPLYHFLSRFYSKTSHCFPRLKFTSSIPPLQLLLSLIPSGAKLRLLYFLLLFSPSSCFLLKTHSGVL